MAAAVKIVGFFDESEDQSILCIAGVVAPIHHWPPFETAWRDLLKDEGIEPELHMSDCENRRGAFEHWTDPGERHRVQHRFLGLIADSPCPSPVGVAVAIDLDAYKAGGHGTRPWLSAFKLATERMLRTQAMFNSGTGVDDRVALFFDEKDEFRGRALQLVDQAKTESAHGSLIDSVTFADSAQYPALQAADLLVYEARRCLTEVIKGGKRARAQWKRLQDAKLPSGQRRIWAEYYDSSTADFRELLAWE